VVHIGECLSSKSLGSKPSTAKTIKQNKIYKKSEGRGRYLDRYGDVDTN
jgi:hypothetical protein